MPVHEIDYRLIGDDLQIVEIELDPGEAVRAEAGAMLYTDEAIRMDTGTGGGFMKGLKRRIAGESFFITSFTNEGSTKARVAFSAPYPGKVVPLNLSHYGGRFLCQKDTFLCAAKGIEIEVAFTKKIGAGLFGGEGFILQKLTGDGLAFCHAGGTIVERDLAGGERLRVDTGCLVAFSETVDYDIQFQTGFKNALFGGEGLVVATVTGPGKVFLQSLPFSRLADRIVAASRMYGRQGETSRGGSGALGAIGGLAAGGLLGGILGEDN
ncbi:MAG: TIGR00266 family protein [Bacteroidota bacterium]